MCPTCGTSGATLLGELPDIAWFGGTKLQNILPGGSLYRCVHCCLKFRFPIRSAAVYAQMYNNIRTDNWAAYGKRRDWDLIISTIKRLRPNASSILDFGCYTGGLLSRIEKRCNLFGVEISRSAAQVARDASGATVWDSIAAIPCDTRFDVIVAADVVEHVADPKALIEQLLPLLSPDGILVITTGDADAPLWRRFGSNWWYCYYAEHIAFISRQWVEHLEATSPVSVIEISNFSYRRLRSFRRVLETTSMYAYGIFPRTFLRLKRISQRLRGRDGQPNVPGNGISADHLLVVLGRGSKP